MMKTLAEFKDNTGLQILTLIGVLTLIGLIVFFLFAYSVEGCEKPKGILVTWKNAFFPDCDSITIDSAWTWIGDKPPPPPLRMKIDTVRVDTDTLCYNQVEVKKHIDNWENYWRGGCDSYVYAGGGMSDCTIESHYKIDSVWTPITDITYTIDTTYYLTPEQVKMLESK